MSDVTIHKTQSSDGMVTWWSHVPGYLAFATEEGDQHLLRLRKSSLSKGEVLKQEACSSLVEAKTWIRTTLGALNG